MTFQYCNRNGDNSDMTTKSKQINIVLVETSHPGNIGSAARAMKTMGLSELSLINPKDFPSGDANALSGNARDILDKAQVFKNLHDALIDSHHIFATSSRKRTIT
jgi:tRNA (cytidine32/uridine32-2'-O)-methyltransferase